MLVLNNGSPLTVMGKSLAHFLQPSKMKFAEPIKSRYSKGTGGQIPVLSSQTLRSIKR